MSSKYHELVLAYNNEVRATSTTEVSNLPPWYFDDFTDAFADIDPVYMILGIILNFLYCTYVFIDLQHPFASRAFTGSVMGLFFILLSEVTALFGVYLLTGKQPNPPMMIVLPILGLGLGLDDLFVLVRYYSDLDYTFLRKHGPEELIGETLARGGVGTLLTSVCNVLSFGVGWLGLPIPAMSDFCLAAALLALMNYITNINLLLPMLKFEADRMVEGKPDLHPLVYSRHKKMLDDVELVKSRVSVVATSSKQFSNSTEKRVLRWLKLSFAPWLTSIPGAVGFSVFGLTIFIAMLISLKDIDMGWRPQDLTPKTHYLNTAFEALFNLFTVFPFKLMFFDIDVASNQAGMLQLAEDLSSYEKNSFSSLNPLSLFYLTTFQYQGNLIQASFEADYVDPESVIQGGIIGTQFTTDYLTNFGVLSATYAGLVAANNSAYLSSVQENFVNSVNSSGNYTDRSLIENMTNYPSSLSEAPTNPNPMVSFIESSDYQNFVTTNGFPANLLGESAPSISNVGLWVNSMLQTGNDTQSLGLQNQVLLAASEVLIKRWSTEMAFAQAAANGSPIDLATATALGDQAWADVDALCVAAATAGATAVLTSGGTAATANANSTASYGAELSAQSLIVIGNYVLYLLQLRMTAPPFNLCTGTNSALCSGGYTHPTLAQFGVFTRDKYDFNHLFTDWRNVPSPAVIAAGDTRSAIAKLAGAGKQHFVIKEVESTANSFYANFTAGVSSRQPDMNFFVFEGSNIDLETESDYITMIEESNKILERSPLANNAYLYGDIVSFWTVFIELKSELWSLMLYQNILIFLATLILFEIDVLSAVIVTLSCFMIVIQSYGMVMIAVKRFNVFVCALILMVMGMSVEFVCHLAAAFSLSAGGSLLKRSSSNDTVEIEPFQANSGLSTSNLSTARSGPRDTTQIVPHHGGPLGFGMPGTVVEGDHSREGVEEDHSISRGVNSDREGFSSRSRDTDCHSGTVSNIPSSDSKIGFTSSEALGSIGILSTRTVKITEGSHNSPPNNSESLRDQNAQLISQQLKKINLEDEVALNHLHPIQKCLAESIVHTFPALMEGMVSTLLGIFPLIFHPVAFYTDYIFMITFIGLVFGALNGFLVLPAMLSLLGRLKTAVVERSSGEGG